MPQISLNIPQDQYDLWKKNGWKHKEIYGLGIQAKLNNPLLMSRVRELEDNMMKMQSKLTFYASRAAELEEKLRRVGQ